MQGNFGKKFAKILIHSLGLRPTTAGRQIQKVASNFFQDTIELLTVIQSLCNKIRRDFLNLTTSRGVE